eukprot:Protomagalhaensia_sp_Gyna_25__756@NODE_1362_length_1907_cov_14_283191_g1094_i0_p3_GENE_NODE_1362_length_1907_cov_14_283191_g1094_i0NODE_1362_length_1907_cov_14_283191_g1094_i0_p3_ORF_typecomplete_len103_score3_51_NODE_1362_length_1907_cov_14_283191_g1094_i014461754
MSGYRGVQVPVGEGRSMKPFLFALASTGTGRTEVAQPEAAKEYLRCYHCGDRPELSSRLKDHFLKRKALCPAVGYTVRHEPAQDSCTCAPLQRGFGTDYNRF